MGAPYAKPQPPVNVENPEGSTNIKQDAGNSLIEVNLDSNGDGSGLTVWSILLIVAGTLVVVYVLRRFKACRKKAKIQRCAQESRQARLEAIALMPRQFDNDRFEEIDVRVDRQIEAPVPPPVAPVAPDQPEAPVGNHRRSRRG